MATIKSTEKHQMEKLADKFDKYKNGYFFPNDDIDPKNKKGSWCLAWQQAIWSLFIKNSTYTQINGSPDNNNYMNLQQLRLYGAGRQPNGIYMDMLIGDESMNPYRHGFLSTNWEVFSPMPKFKRLIRGRFEQQDYNYTANAVDPTSQAKKEDEKWEIWYNSQFGEREAQIKQAILGIKDENQKAKYVASSLDDLNMFQEMGGIKLKEEAEIETVLDATDYISDIRVIKQKVLDDLVDFGKAAYRDFYDSITGLVKKEYVDWENLIIDYSTETDFKDIRFWSYIKFETLNNVRIRTGLDEAEVMKLARINCGYWGNMDSTMFNYNLKNGLLNEKGVRFYNQFRVPILISEWISTDSEYKLAKTKNGTETYYPQEHGKMYNTENKKTKVTQVNNVYNSTWIIGSEYVYDDGLSLNIARPNPKEPQLSIHAIVLPGKSITETIKPNLDQLALGWVRWQSAIAQAPPAGMDWDISQLEGINLGTGKDMTPLQLIWLRRQTGDSFRRTTALQKGSYNNVGKSSSRNEGGIGSFFQEIITTMDVNFKYIADLTGIDLISGASMKPGETTATEVKHSSAATTDALQPYFTSWMQMQEHSAQTITCKIQRAIKYHPEAKEAYEGILGRAGAKILSIGADTTAASFGIKIEVKSSQEMVQFAMNTILEAVKMQEVSPADGYYFVDMIQRGRVKHAMALFAYKEAKSKADAMKLQADNMAQNRQTAMQTQQMKNDGVMNKIQAEGTIDMKTEAIKALLQMKVDDNAHLHQLKEMYVEQLLTPQEQGQPPQGGGQNPPAATPPAQQVAA